MKLDKCHGCVGKSGLIGFWVNVFLATLKFAIGYTSGSKALLADGLHSASNIITALAIMVSQKITKRESNSKYSYGFGKAEFLIAAFVSLLIATGALTLIAVSIKHLLHEPKETPHLTAVLVAAISVATNEMVFRYMRCAGTRFKSKTLLATAWANRADCFSSLAVIVGVIGSRMGFHHMDPIVALLVVVMIIKVSLSILFDSVKSLMDVSVSDLYGDDIHEVVMGFKEVRAVSGLKTRQVGRHIWAEMNIHVDRTCSIREGNRISRVIKRALADKIDDMGEITIYIIPFQTEKGTS